MEGLQVSGKVAICGKSPYMGNSKSGRYASGYFLVKNPKGYGYWQQFYAPGQVAALFEGAQENDAFEVKGYLDENKRKREDGTVERKTQLIVTEARRQGAVPEKANKAWDADTYINDSDTIPF